MKKTITTLAALIFSVSIMAAYAKSDGETKLTGKYFLMPAKYFLTITRHFKKDITQEVESEKSRINDMYIEFIDGGKFKTGMRDDTEEEAAGKILF